MSKFVEVNLSNLFNDEWSNYIHDAVSQLTNESCTIKKGKLSVFRKTFNVEDGLVIVFDFPGAKKEDLDVTNENGSFMITAFREFGNGEKEEFVKTYFKLQDKLDATNCKFTYENGQLIVFAPYKAQAKPQKIEIL